MPEEVEAGRGSGSARHMLEQAGAGGGGGGRRGAGPDAPQPTPETSRPAMSRLTASSLTPAASLTPASATEPEANRSNPLTEHNTADSASSARRPCLSAMGAAVCAAAAAGRGHLVWCRAPARVARSRAHLCTEQPGETPARDHHRPSPSIWGQADFVGNGMLRDIEDTRGEAELEGGQARHGRRCDQAPC